MNAQALPISHAPSLRWTVRRALRRLAEPLLSLDLRYVDPWERKRR